MIRGSAGDKGVEAKQEGIREHEATMATPSRLWLGLKDPRIVRVSRALGGKDRHSKVRTVRGLRDRRVRLSVPTAIQLYDLQERLGLTQPSKVVDWLLHAARHEIDRLPPLQFPPGVFGFVDQFAADHDHTTSTTTACSPHGTSSIVADNGSNAAACLKPSIINAMAFKRSFDQKNGNDGAHNHHQVHVQNSVGAIMASSLSFGPSSHVATSSTVGSLYVDDGPVVQAGLPATGSGRAVVFVPDAYGFSADATMLFPADHLHQY